MKIFKKYLNKILCSKVNIIILIIYIFLFINPLIQPNWWIFKLTYYEIDDNLTYNKCSLRYEQKYVQLKNIFHNKTYGGQYINKDCIYAHKVAIIVPYRNRSEQKDIFLKHIHHFLLTQNAQHYRIYFIEQNDTNSFNRGALMNIGFKSALSEDGQTSCFIFHDVDILPNDYRQYYTCSERPKHLCPYIDKLRYVLLYKQLFGGVIAIKKEHFQELNGYSNSFWGWGGEDDDFYGRIRTKHSHIERYDSVIGRCKMIKHQHNTDESKNRKSLLKNTLKRMSHDGLNNLSDKIIKLKIIKNFLYTNVLVKLNF